MANFDQVYTETVSPRDGIDADRLRPLLEQIYSEALRRPFDSTALRAALVDLARFLCSPVGRTSAYCYAVDYFFQDVSDLWISHTEDLPDEFRDVFTEFCFLHGAVEQPKFHTTPEEILEMIQKIGAKA
jgi:hypothetical protein